MEEQLINRVNIIMNTRFSFIKQENDPHQQYKSTLRIQYISIIIVLATALCALSGIQQIFNLKINVPEWDSIEMTVAIVFPFLFLIPQNFADFLLKKHMIDIIKKKPLCDKASNRDLKKTITSLSDQIRNIIFLFLPLLLVIAALVKVLDINPKWDQFAYLAPLSIILVAIKTFINYRKIKNSIARFEKGTPLKVTTANTGVLATAVKRIFGSIGLPDSSQ